MTRTFIQPVRSVMSYTLARRNFVGDKKCNMPTRWKEHNSPNHDPELANHLKSKHPTCYYLAFLTNAKYTRTRKNLEAIHNLV